MPSASYPGFRRYVNLDPAQGPVRKASARAYVDLATGDVVSRRRAEGLSAKIIRGWHTVKYKTSRGVFNRVKRLPNGVMVWLAAKGMLLIDSGDDLAGTVAWRTFIRPTLSDTLKQQLAIREDIEDRAAELFIAGTVTTWVVRWR